MFYPVIAFFLALIPFVVIPNFGDGIRTPKEIASIIGLVAIIAVCGLYPRKRVNLKWLYLFWGWCAISVIFNSYLMPFLLGYKNGLPIFLALTSDAGVSGIPVYFLAWKELFYISLAITAIYSLASVEMWQYRKWSIFNIDIHSLPSTIKSQTFNISKMITVIVIIMCGYSIIQWAGLDNFFRTTNNQGLVAEHNIGGYWHATHRIVGTLGNPTIFAAWLVTLFPFCLYLKNKLGYVGMTMICVTLILTRSTISWLALLGILMFWLFIKQRRAFVLAMCALCLSVMLVYQHRDNPVIKDYCGLTGRIEVHKVVWEKLRDRPLLGMGLGTFEYMIGINPLVSEKLHDENWKELHDDYGQLWWSVGLIGLGLFLMFIVDVFKRFFRNVSKEGLVYASSMVAFLIVCLALFPMRIAPQSFYGVVFTGLLLNVIGG